MAEDESLVAVVAHALLNNLASIQGPVAPARRQLDPISTHQDRADYLLQLTELEAKP